MDVCKGLTTKMFYLSIVYNSGNVQRFYVFYNKNGWLYCDGGTFDAANAVV